MRHEEEALVRVARPVAAVGRVGGRRVAPGGTEGLVLEVDGEEGVREGLRRGEEGAVELVEGGGAGLEIRRSSA